mmetsp:Transcript_50031/g.119506  ORF Transcript_50031/g.119506 Transcript_50031/m.119506 type:complete len:213 (+) Transcript_50031:426-1064(+)
MVVPTCCARPPHCESSPSMSQRLCRRPCVCRSIDVRLSIPSQVPWRMFWRCTATFWRVTRTPTWSSPGTPRAGASPPRCWRSLERRICPCRGSAFSSPPGRTSGKTACGMPPWRMSPATSCRVRWWLGALRRRAAAASTTTGAAPRCTRRGRWTTCRPSWWFTGRTSCCEVRSPNFAPSGNPRERRSHRWGWKAVFMLQSFFKTFGSQRQML